MKKTLLIELLRTIKKTMVSFISIVVFVMLGIGLFEGIDWSVEGFKKTVDSTVKSGNMYNIELSYPYGFDYQFINELKQNKNIDKAEGYYICNKVFSFEDITYQTKIISLTKDINKPISLFGNLPSKNNEIAVEKIFADQHNIKIGDQIIFNKDEENKLSMLNALLDEDLDALKDVQDNNIPTLKEDTFIVSALLEMPQYISKYKITYGVNLNTNIPNDCIMFVNEDAFDKEAFSGYSNVILVNNELSNVKALTDEYNESSTVFTKSIKDVVSNYTNTKNNKLLKSISNVENKIKNEIGIGEKEIEDGEKAIANGKTLISNGKKELADAKELLEDSQNEVDKGWLEVNKAKQEIADSEKKLIRIQKLYDTTLKLIDFYIYVVDNYEDIKTTIVDIHNIYEVNKTIIQSILPDDYYVLEILDELYVKLNAGEYDDKIDQFMADYLDAIDKIQSNPNYQSIPDIIAAFKDSDIDECKTIGEKLDSLFGGIEEFLQLPSNIVETYKLLAQVGLLPFFEDTISEAIDTYLTSQGCPTLKEIFSVFTDAIDKGYEEYNQILPYVDEIFGILKDSLVIVTDFRQFLYDKHYLLDEAWQKLNDGKAQLSAGITKLNKAQEEIDKGWIEYQDGLNTITNKEKELNDGIQKVADAKVKLEDGRKQLKKYQDLTNDIKAYDGSLLERDANASLVTVTIPLKIIDNVKYTIALLFVLVGVFVSYTAISRLVYENSKQIGTKKALGLHSKEITISFLIYVLIAVIVGSILGFFVARFAIEPIVVNTLCKNYITNTTVYSIDVVDLLLFILFELVVNILSAFLACRNVLKKKAVALLNGENSSRAKQRFFEKIKLWNKLSLFTKTIINNFFSDGRRILGTLVGIVGCCALMTSPLLLTFDMHNSLDYQLKNITKYDTIIYLDPSVDNSLDNIMSRLEKNDIACCPTYYSNLYVKKDDGNYIATYIYAFEDDKFYDMFNIINNGKDTKISDGIWICESVAKNNGYKEGSLVEFIDNQGKKYQVEYVNDFEFYALRSQMVVNKATFEKMFEEEFYANTISLIRDERSINELYDILDGTNGLVSIFDAHEEIKTINNAVISPTYIVMVVFISLAIALALLVLLNLLVMFVDEKKKELIVLMINGYSKKDAKKYIYKDTILLTIIGIIIGCILGTIVGILTLKTFESEAVSYIITPSFKACAIAAISTAALTLMTSLIALKRVDKLKLKDINS